ncbi:MAG: MATE family efflux transporter [Firmicutes bacterium]|nr:MATE family efflux transporter [Bacillota bacterium]
MTENNIYNKPVTSSNMLKFAIPTMIRMVFISVYTIVDGIVVSNFVGSVGLSAINIVYPVLNVTMALAFMFGMGSNALIGKKLGEGKGKDACSFMTLTVLLNVGLVALLTAVFFMADEKIYMLMGSDEALLPYCVEYGNIMVAISPVWVMQVLFQSFLVTADKPKMGLYLSVISGVLNVVLDLLFVGVWDMGLTGAALASAAGICVGGLIPLTVLFSKKNLLHFARPVWVGRDVLKAIGNGSSEMVVNLASAVTTALFNIQMMSLAGEKGVAAISAILYLQFVFVAVFIGFTSGLGPLVSFNYGAQNRENIKKIFSFAFKFTLIFSAAMVAAAELFNRSLTMIFASRDEALAELMISGFAILAVSIFFSGINIFASGFFTALNNGKVSALISFMRTFAFQAGALVLLPMVWGIEGVWWALPLSEILSAVLAVFLLIKYRKNYGY